MQTPATLPINVTFKTVTAKFPRQWRKCGDCARDMKEGERLYYTRKGKKIALIQCGDCALKLVMEMTAMLDRTA
jgi:transcription elongation factor Elf1